MREDVQKRSSSGFCFTSFCLPRHQQYINQMLPLWYTVENAIPLPGLVGRINITKKKKNTLGDKSTKHHLFTVVHDWTQKTQFNHVMPIFFHLEHLRPMEIIRFKIVQAISIFTQRIALNHPTHQSVYWNITEHIWTSTTSWFRHGQIIFKLRRCSHVWRLNHVKSPGLRTAGGRPTAAPSRPPTAEPPAPPIGCRWSPKK